MHGALDFKIKHCLYDMLLCHNPIELEAKLGF
jgi:hypothetical protein